MVEAAVSLPEPRPEDDEDVVWGLSTASALWARGERKDAIVWLRRAPDAAPAAGQDFRASELGMYASEIEDRLNAAPPSDDEPRPTLTSGVELDDEAPPVAPPPNPPPLAPRPATMRPPKVPTMAPPAKVPTIAPTAPLKVPTVVPPAPPSSQS